MGPIASKQQAWQTRRQFRRADKALFDEFQAFQKSIALSHWWMQEFANLTGGLRFHGAATSDYGNCGSQAFSARNRTHEVYSNPNGRPYSIALSRGMNADS